MRLAYDVAVEWMNKHGDEEIKNKKIKNGTKCCFFIYKQVKVW